MQRMLSEFGFTEQEKSGLEHQVFVLVEQLGERLRIAGLAASDETYALLFLGM